MQVYDRLARDTLRLPDGDAVAPWAMFDPDWFRMRYPGAPELPDVELLEWYVTEGQLRGLSPNRYFDEEWQRRAWPGIRELIEAGSVDSAFDAWCRGAHAGRAPHWLFDPREYRIRYPALTDEVLVEAGFLNLYHHYLSRGAAEGRIGHPLFDPTTYIAGLDPAEAAAATMPFLHYLRRLESGAPERRTSPLFDLDWYRARYPDASHSVAVGQYRSLLQHYLCNDRPTEFDPSPWFSEAHYLAENPGLAGSIGPDGFRNGFVHFLAHGLQEGRSPHPDLDLAWYANRDEVRADIEAERASDAFSHWIAIGHPAGHPGRPPLVTSVTEPGAVALYEQRANTIWPLLGRRKLDFTPGGVPSISVIMAVRSNFAATMVSLASLRAQYHGDIDLILIQSDPGPPGVDIETHVTGATILRFGTVLNDNAARDAGLICAVADTILLLGDGVDLAPGAIDVALARLTSDPAIAAVGARLVQPQGTLLEAGGIVWRDGRLQAYARDASPLAPEANFVREVDFCSTLFLLARRDVLSALPEQQGGLAGTTHDAADLCLRIHEAGFRVIYEPDALAFLTNHPSDRGADGQAAFVAAHSAYLATRPVFDPAAALSARAPDRGQPHVLYVEDAIPLRRIGSGFVRSNEVVRALVTSGATVTVFPMQANHFPLSIVRAESPDEVEVMHDRSAADFASFIAARRDYYDVIWIARTHNLDQLHEALADFVPNVSESEDLAARTVAALPMQSAALLGETFDLNAVLRQAFGQVDAPTGPEIATVPRRGVADDPVRSRRIRIVVDTEAVTSVRQAEQAALLNQAFDLDTVLRQEFRHLDAAMDVVAVTEAEAEIIRAHHRGEVNVLGHAIAATPTPRGFEERTGILFVGAIHGMDHPNYDGLAWFVDEVLPLIERTLRWETRLTVAGYTAPGVFLDRFKGHPRVTLRGAVPDLVPLYDANRVFIAPTRFAAGIPYKVHEAAAHGIPVVATSLVARQLGWRDGEAIAAADVTDPGGFAARVIALHRDATLWNRIRTAALGRVETELDPSRFASIVARLASSKGVATPPYPLIELGGNQFGNGPDEPILE
jgi:glycosyltransferase involved in cell wall biosynthesis